MKRIVICCDGTWNSPDVSHDGVPCHTNVARVAAAVLPEHDGTRQLMYYNSGVGAIGRRLYRAFAGATGWGLSANLLDAYNFLIRNYVPGDELYLFGFSRGAFTVRSLGGLINNSGVLRPKHVDQVDRAFEIYAARQVASHPRKREATLFRKTYAYEDRTPIHFIGVWDTVGALGNPILMMKSPLSRRHKFHDTGLSSSVANAFHALAIDEKRRHFEATLWHKQPDTDEKRVVKGLPQQKLEQRWFVGVHTNVGGGYKGSGLSDIALKWMAAKADECDLGVCAKTMMQDANGEMKLEESRKGLYKLVPRFDRPIDDARNKAIELADGEEKVWETCESVDESVLTYREKNAAYRPPELEKYFARQGSGSGDPMSPH